MGINKLNELFKNNNIKPYKVSYSDFKGKTIAIDFSILITKILTKSSELSYKGKITTHIFGIYKKLYQMIISGINIIIIFDGKQPKIKKQKNNGIIDKNIIDDIKKLLKLLGIKYIQSYGEADTQIAYLFKLNKIDAVYSNDTDMLVFGCKILLTSFNKTDGLMYVLNDILNKLNISMNKFINICIILGNDYYPGIKNIGPKKVLFEYNNIKNIFNKDKLFLKTKNYYLLKKIKLKNKILNPKPNLIKLKKYLIIDLGFNEIKTENEINKIKNLNK